MYAGPVPIAISPCAYMPGRRRSSAGRSTYTTAVRSFAEIVGATTRIVPWNGVPSAVVTLTPCPGAKSLMRVSGASPRHSMRPLRKMRSISPPACAICPTVTVRDVTMPSSGATTFVNFRRNCDVSRSARADSSRDWEAISSDVNRSRSAFESRFVVASDLSRCFSVACFVATSASSSAVDSETRRCPLRTRSPTSTSTSATR